MGTHARQKKIHAVCGSPQTATSFQMIPKNHTFSGFFPSFTISFILFPPTITIKRTQNLKRCNIASLIVKILMQIYNCIVIYFLWGKKKKQKKNKGTKASQRCYSSYFRCISGVRQWFKDCYFVVCAILFNNKFVIFS